MNNPKVSNPNDRKVMSFHNSTEFGFTPAMGCMYDGIAINGKNGSPGIDAGETVILPYHVAQQLAINLAKISITKSAPNVDPAGIPTGVPLWDTQKLDNLKNSYLKELYTEERPLEMSETAKLMAKVEEYKGLVDKLINKNAPTVSSPQPPQDNDYVTPGDSQFAASDGKVYQDKQEVIAELEKRGIKFDRRLNKSSLEKLLM